ncbi:MAG TPA: RebB family R body protein [Caulobacteraceae bacterium]|nr:RebB family R body protein [Caulobacteraceae bacterium]
MADPDPETEVIEAAEQAEQAELRAARAAEAAVAAADRAQPPGAQSAAGHATVNDQLIDALTAVEAAGESPPLTGAALAQIRAQAVGLALLNAAGAQQNAYVTANATVLAAVARILAAGGRTAQSDAQGAKSGG